MKHNVIGIDLAKEIFQVCVLNTQNTVLSNKSVKRARLEHTVRQYSPQTHVIAMEACATAHYWGQVFQDMGFEVSLLPAQHVKAFTRGQKNDAQDALAICEAAQRPAIHCVPVKNKTQQEIKSLRAIRKRWVKQRTALSNQIRGLCAEFGVHFTIGLRPLRKGLVDLFDGANRAIPVKLFRYLRVLYEELCGLDEQIKGIDKDIQEVCQTNPLFKVLQSIPGCGPLIAAACLSEMGSGQQFQSGRQFSAFVGLVPRQHSSGGKACLLGLSKNGDRELRTLFIHGARAVFRFCRKKDTALSHWLNALILRRGKNRAIVALANKLARICWAVLTTGKAFEMSKAFA